MYHIFQEQVGSQVIFREIVETTEELNAIIANPTIPVKFVYNDIMDTYTNLSGYDLSECQGIVGSTLK